MGGSWLCEGSARALWLGSHCSPSSCTCALGCAARTTSPLLPSPPLSSFPQEYVSQCHELRDGIESMVRAKGVEASPTTPANLPWFDLLAHPAA